MTIGINAGKTATTTHVVPHEGHWAVKQGGDVLGTYRLKSDAVDAGRIISRRDRTEFYIHNADGTIGEKDSHGNDPRDIRG